MHARNCALNGTMLCMPGVNALQLWLNPTKTAGSKRLPTATFLLNKQAFILLKGAKVVAYNHHAVKKNRNKHAVLLLEGMNGTVCISF